MRRIWHIGDLPIASFYIDLPIASFYISKSAANIGSLKVHFLKLLARCTSFRGIFLVCDLRRLLRWAEGFPIDVDTVPSSREQVKILQVLQVGFILDPLGTGPDSLPNAAAISPDENTSRLPSPLGGNGNALLVDVSTGQSIFLPSPNNSSSNFVAFDNKNGRLLAIAFGYNFNRDFFPKRQEQ